MKIYVGSAYPGSPGLGLAFVVLLGRFLTQGAQTTQCFPTRIHDVVVVFRLIVESNPTLVAQTHAVFVTQRLKRQFANHCGAKQRFQVDLVVDDHGSFRVILRVKLLFRMEKNVVAFAEGFVVGGVDVEITGVVRGYLPGRDNPLATVYVQDSVFWSESADNMEQLKLYLPSPDEALRAAGQYIGTKITPNFVPHWDNESRWFYKGEGARWKEATAYALSDKWEEAALRWKHVYENSSRWKERAKAASNLALYYEMKTQLKEAYNWAAKSYEIFNSKKGEDYNYTKMQRLYVEALGKRIRSDQKLNKQFGE